MLGTDDGARFLGRGAGQTAQVLESAVEVWNDAVSKRSRPSTIGDQSWHHRGTQHRHLPGIGKMAGKKIAEAQQSEKFIKKEGPPKCANP